MNVVKEERDRKAYAGLAKQERISLTRKKKKKEFTDLLLISLESNSEFH